MLKSHNKQIKKLKQKKNLILIIGKSKIRMNLLVNKQNYIKEQQEI